MNRLPLRGRFGAAVSAVLATVLAYYVRTLRVRLFVAKELDPADPRPWVLCFFHGEQVPLLAWKRRRGTVAMVSLSRDGQRHQLLLKRLGLDVVRGSSSRRGAAALREVVERLLRGSDAAFAVDGPKGPVYRVKPGAITAARLSGAQLVPMGGFAPSSVRLARSWDKLCLPLPFSRVHVSLGKPIDAERATELDLEEAIRGLRPIAQPPSGARQPCVS